MAAGGTQREGAWGSAQCGEGEQRRVATTGFFTVFAIGVGILYALNKGVEYQVISEFTVELVGDVPQEGPLGESLGKVSAPHPPHAASSSVSYHPAATRPIAHAATTGAPGSPALIEVPGLRELLPEPNSATSQELVPVGRGYVLPVLGHLFGKVEELNLVENL